jgi:hypothetical protein
MSRIEQQRKN